MFEGFVQDSGGVRFYGSGADLELRFTRPGQVAVGWGGGLAEPSYAVVGLSEGTPLSVEVDGGGWLVRGEGIGVAVDADAALTYFDGHGRARRQDGPPEWDGQAWRLRTALPSGASVHGLGGRSVWDLRGGTYRCWNTDPGGAWLPGRDPLYVTTPAYVVLDDHGAAHCFVDNSCDATIDVTGDDISARFEAGPARWYVGLGSLAEVLDAFTALTGRPTPPPRWALGHHQARWGYGSSAAVREVWSGFRRHDLPLSAIHLDIDHMDRFRNFTFGEQWQDTAGLVAEMAADGVRTVVIVDAGVAKADDYPEYRDGLGEDVFCRDRDGEVYVGEVWPGPTAFPDFTSPAARTWWGSRLAAYDRIGVAGYWHDMNEPVSFSSTDGATLPLSTRHDMDGRPADHRSAHNIYGLQMCRASYEGLRRLHPDRRPFLISRSGFAGMQRYGGHWSGDIQTDWSSLRSTIHQALGFGVSGVGYYGSDIGGFTGEPSPELFTRWFQLASFLPLFRTHCAFYAPRREPWEWGEDVMRRLRLALRRRYRLMPYWYTLALSSMNDGAPYIRPLTWQDPTARGVDDQFLLGDDILVAPVLDEGATDRPVVLPAGVWFHGDTGRQYAGSVSIPVGPQDTPWFVRAGAVVPTEEESRLVLLVAPRVGGRTASGGRLLTDTGDGWAAAHEERYEAADSGSGVVVSRQIVHQGDFGFAAVEVRSLDGRPARLA